MSEPASNVAKLDAPTKRCWKCDTAKPIASFSKDKSRADGLQPICRPCAKVARQAYLAAHPDGQRKAWAKWYAEPENAKTHSQETVARARARADELIARYKDVPCMDCGNRFITAAMEFDHRPGTVKCFNIGYNALGRFAIANVLAEIEKCDVVCANCHRVRTMARNQAGRKGSV